MTARLAARSTLVVAALAACLVAPSPAAIAAAPLLEEPMWLDHGLVVPYPLDNVFRGFAACRRGRHRHKALDIGGVGPDWGVGTPIRAIARAKITAIATPEDDPERRGRRLVTGERTTRGRKSLPIGAEIPGYGQVYFFTEDHGRSRTGVMLVMTGLEGKLRRHTITYLHLAAVHPDLAVGDVVEAGQEVGLMGGTAVQESAPHLHLAITAPSGRALDIGPLLGIGRTSAQCRLGRRGERKLRAAYSKRARTQMAERRQRRAQTHQLPDAPELCGQWVEDVAPAEGRFRDHLIAIPSGAVGDGPAGGPWTLRVTRRAGRWQPRIVVETGLGRTLYDGRRARRDDARTFGITRERTGQRGAWAEVTVTRPPRDRSDNALRVRIARWQRDRLLPEGAGYEIALKRPCPTTD